MKAELQLSVVVACYNEALNVPELTERVLRTFERGRLRAELVLVDDGSIDATASVIHEQVDAHPESVVATFHDRNLGLAAAWKTGVTAARGATIAVLDADLQYQPEDILRLYRTLAERSVDIVQGWRSPIGRERDKRYYLSRGFNTLLNNAFGMRLRDNKSGFVCCSKDVMLDLLTYEGTYDYWQSFIMVAAHAKGYSIQEVEILFEKRKQGTSFLEGASAYRASARSLVDLSRAFVEYRLRTEPHDVTRYFLEDRGIPIGQPPSRKKSPLRWRTYMASFDATHWTITKRVERYYESLNTTQWLSPRQIRELQNEKLRRLVRHAYRSVPYYRVRMQELGLGPEDIRSQDDLHKLPLLSKSDVRKNLYFDMMQEGVSHASIQRITTSGSTGEPFTCYADRGQLEFRWAATLRSQEWTGYRFGDPLVRLWHQNVGMTGAQVAKERVDAWMSNRVHVPVFEMTESNLAHMIRTLELHRPVLVDGYAEALNFLAEYVEERGALGASPRAIMSSAQTLPRKSRQIIERSFGCRVFDKYGSREFSGIAYESDAHDGHLVVAEGYIVEILVGGRPARPGEMGEVVITDLNNFCMPFIRYRIGDLAEAVEDRPSRCGRGLPRVGDIQGRVQSIIQGTDGHFVPGTFFSHVIKEYDYAIRQFQVVQRRPAAIRLRLVKGTRFSDDTLEEILALIRRYLGDDLRIDVEFAPSIDLVATGKRFASVSTLNTDIQQDNLKPAVGIARVLK